MHKKRAVFNFDLEFTNGGGLQGQGFRLDIHGDDIDDESLTAYILRDLRLLMVGRVSILNKRIVDEPHKRSSPDVAGQHGHGSVRIESVQPGP